MARDGDGDGARRPPQLAAPTRWRRARNSCCDLGYQPGLDWGLRGRGAGRVRLSAGDARPAAADLVLRRARASRGSSGAAFSDPSIPVFLYVPTGAERAEIPDDEQLSRPQGLQLLRQLRDGDAHICTDRLKGGGDFVHAWPRDTKFPNLEQRKAIQEALIKLGLYERRGRWAHRAGQPGGLCEVPGQPRARWPTASSRSTATTSCRRCSVAFARAALIYATVDGLNGGHAEEAATRSCSGSSALSWRRWC